MSQPSLPSHTPPPPYGYYPADDEINLMDLWRILMARKSLIIAITILVTLGAAAYAFLAPSVYKAETVFLPPSQHDIHALNVQGVQGVQGVSVDSVYALFKRNLGALSLQKEFFIRSGERDRLRAKAGAETTDEQLFISFSDGALAIETDKKDKDALRFVVRDSNPEKAAQLANDFSAFAERATVQALILDVQTAVKNRIAMIENNLSSKRVIAKQRRLDRIAELKEALEIAQRLNLSEQINAPAQVTANTTAGGGISVNTGSTPLFYRGTNALNAELLVLKARESDDPFISGLRDSQEELARLRSVNLDPNVLKVAKTDQPAYAPTSREKPKRKLIVMLGFVLGGMLGVFAAFFVNFVQSQKETKLTN